MLRASRCTVSLSPRSPGIKTAGPFRHKCGGATLLSPFQQKGVSYRHELINITGFPNDSKKRTNTGECVTMKPSYFFSSAREENKEHMNMCARDNRCFLAVTLIASSKRSLSVFVSVPRLLLQLRRKGGDAGDSHWAKEGFPSAAHTHKHAPFLACLLPPQEPGDHLFADSVPREAVCSNIVTERASMPARRTLSLSEGTAIPLPLERCAHTHCHDCSSGKGDTQTRETYDEHVHSRI